MNNSQGKQSGFQSSNSNPGPVYYEIKVQGQLDLLWSKWFEGMTLTHLENDESGTACTLIAGPVIDQSALHGMLTKILDLNLTLISVRRFNSGTNIVENVSIKPDSSEGRDEVERNVEEVCNEQPTGHRDENLSKGVW